MNPKRMTFWLLILLSLSTAASAQQLTKADLQALENRGQALEIKVSNLEIKVEEMDKRLTAQIQAVNARIDDLDKHIGTQINILIGVVLAAIALPQVLGYLQSRREREEFQKQLHDLQTGMQHQIREQRAETQQQIQEMRQEIREQRAETQQQIQETRQEIRDLGERLDRQLQGMFEKFSQQQQEIEGLKSSRIVTPS